MNAASIAKTLEKKGRAMTLSRTTAGTYNPVTGGSTPTTATYTVHGITTSYGYNAYNDSNTLIQKGDKQAIFEAGILEPIPSDTLTIQGIIWKVISVDTINPAGTDLLYKCQIRK
jgi:hypothetical protein